MTHQAVLVRIVGRVQGVGYRNWTCVRARELKICGWVRNCADGSVEALLSGSETAVSCLLEELKVGPQYAVVERVEQALATEPFDEKRFAVLETC